MNEERAIQNFYETLVGQVHGLHAEPVDDAGDSKEFDSRLAEVILGYMEESGYADEPQLCPYEDIDGRSGCRITGFGFKDDKQTLEIYTCMFISGKRILSLEDRDIAKLTGRAARFFECIAKNDLKRFSDNPSILAAANYIRKNIDKIELVRVHVLTNGYVENDQINPLCINGRNIEFFVMDILRLFHMSNKPLSLNDIEVDFVELTGRPLPVLEVRENTNDYETYLAIFPGDLIYSLYEKYGPRLLEFNVRSFLQARGTVNRGIRDTLRSNPNRFLAYNNGITATINDVDVRDFYGQTCIYRCRGLQIVNGGQTTASIHRAGKQDKVELKQIAVAAKITRVEEENLAEFVPLISKFSNTQNVIQVADLSANHPFHIEIEKLSQSVWGPEGNERWFYERTRGAYQTALSQFGTTRSRREEFTSIHPNSKKFTKTDLAKFLMTWIGRPHDVCRGAQKNFAVFMDELDEIMLRLGGELDQRFFRRIIAKKIFFQVADLIVRQEKFPAYRANIVTYLAAYTAFRFGNSFDLEKIWHQENLSDELQQCLRAWSHEINDQILNSSGDQNVTEWTKKEECWNQIKEVNLHLSNVIPPEILFESEQLSSDIYISTEIIRCKSLSAEEWVRVASWGRESGQLKSIEWKVAKTMADYSIEGWPKNPSEKQLSHAINALNRAIANNMIEESK